LTSIAAPLPYPARCLKNHCWHALPGPLLHGPDLPSLEGSPLCAFQAQNASCFCAGLGAFTKIFSLFFKDIFFIYLIKPKLPGRKAPNSPLFLTCGLKDKYFIF
jgi:hypothetical protein